MLFLNFDIDLTFACLREAASAKAGILKFGIRNPTPTQFFNVSTILFAEDDEGNVKSNTSWT